MNSAPHPGISAALRLHSTTASYASGVSVFRLGAPAHFVFLVETGIVRLRRLGREGEEIVLHEAGPGDFFAEASLDSHRYHCEAVAMGATKLLRIPTAALRTLLDSDSAFAREWSALLAARLRAARARVERLSLRSASERVRHLLVSEGRGAQFEIPIAGKWLQRPRIDLAASTGVQGMQLSKLHLALTFLIVLLAFEAKAGEVARQAEVARLGADVMPFSLAATPHVFFKTGDGGIERVEVKRTSDTAQVQLVRSHLRQIREEFLKGDFSGPEHIHGQAMPGLETLKRAKPGQIRIAYRDVATGAELTLRASDPQLILALHAWFDAQLSDHGDDATAEHHHHEPKASSR